MNAIEQLEQVKQLEKEEYKVDFAKLARLVITDLSLESKSMLFSNFPKERVLSALKNAQKNEKLLRDLSNYLYVLSPHYRRLCGYYAQMPKFYYYIEPYKLDLTKKINKQMFLKSYYNILDVVDNMNIGHEFSKINEVLFREGIFYGYIYETEESFFIQKLDADYCKISGVEDGCFTFKFDLRYFDKYRDSLDKYSREFKNAYDRYKNNKKEKGLKSVSNWLEVSSKNSICVKTDESILYPFPPFSSIFPLIYGIEDKRALQDASEELDNYKIISGKIPLNDKSGKANDFVLGLDTAIEFANRISQELPDGVGFLLSPFEKLELYKLQNEYDKRDIVESATKDFWMSSGISTDLFGGKNSTDASSRRAVIVDMSIVFNLLRQYERWINRRIKFRDKKYKYKVTILDITELNKQEYINLVQKSASYGLPIKTMLASAFGLSPSAVVHMNYLENDILELPTKWVPLISANTVSVTNSPTDGNVGKPTNEQVEQSGGEE